MTVTVAAFYKFTRLDDPLVLRHDLLEQARALELKGTVLLAGEGINGTVTGSVAGLAAFIAQLRADPRFADLRVKTAVAGSHPFQRLKVKVKREIIAFRQSAADPTVRVGTYVRPSEWNALIRQPDVLVLDTRNAYEVALGTFDGAIDPGTRRFGELPQFVEAHLDPARHRRIAMFCTGGIRCEKASAYLLAQGFAEVYHLEGGILAYLDAVPCEESLWRGRCFVFDEREGVTGDR